MEDSKVEKFQRSRYFTVSTLPLTGTKEGTHKSGKSIAEAAKNRPSELDPQLPEKNNDELEDSNIAVNLCPDGNSINLSINGTTLTATKTSLNATIGNFTISINDCTLIKGDCPVPPPPPEPSLVAVITTHGYPLHVALEDSPCVKATHSLSKLNEV